MLYPKKRIYKKFIKIQLLVNGNINTVVNLESRFMKFKKWRRITTITLRFFYLTLSIFPQIFVPNFQTNHKKEIIIC